MFLTIRREIWQFYPDEPISHSSLDVDMNIERLECFPGALLKEFGHYCLLFSAFYKGNHGFTAFKREPDNTMGTEMKMQEGDELRQGLKRELSQRIYELEKGDCMINGIFHKVFLSLFITKNALT